MKNFKAFTVLLTASLLSSTSVYAECVSAYAPSCKVKEYFDTAQKLAEEIEIDINEKVYEKVTSARSEYTYDPSPNAVIPEEFKTSAMNEKINKNEKSIFDNYEKLLSILNDAENEYKDASCEGSETDDCRALGLKVGEIEGKVEHIRTLANASYSMDSGYIWITEDNGRFLRMQKVVERTLEKNMLIKEQMAEIDDLVQNGIGGGGYIPQYSTSSLVDLTANTRAVICTDEILTAADESAKKASQVYGGMLMPYKYPTVEEDVKKLEELKQRFYRDEIAYSLAISTYNLNRIADETEKDLKELQKQSEGAKTQAEMIGANTKIVTRISEEVIPLIVNVATTTTMETIGAVKRVPRKDVIIK